MENIFFKDDFIKNRKEQKRIRRDSSKCQFRGKRIEDIIQYLMQVHSIFSYEDVAEFRKEGFIKIKDNSNRENIGAFYLREYDDLSKNNLIKSNLSNEMVYVLTLVVY